MYVNDNIYRLRSSIALVYNKGELNIFKTNIRENVFLKINYDNIIQLLQLFDGRTKLSDIIKNCDIAEDTLISLVQYLNNKYILICVDKDYPIDLIETKYRIINFLEDYCKSSTEVLHKISLLNKKKVLIFGLGAVGTWIVDMLARDGVMEFILVDDDIVDISNLHRQDFYFEDDIGRKKLDVIETKLKQIDSNISVKKIYKKLDFYFFNDFDKMFDLAINCADYPNVDTTTAIIASECMKRNIPHIIGGGYNLHLTLIGQSVIPYKSACFKCFDTKLNQINEPFTHNLKKLHRENRKVGSFSPLCTLSASLASIEAFKILCDLEEFLINTSKRIEFGLRSMDFSIIDIPKDDNCITCSKDKINGNYRYKNT
jgi:molybdopterin/thiamine biosynthesis adenylyltransferase